MKRLIFALCLPLFVASCALNSRGTLADLHNVEPELKDETVEDGLDKAMQSYRRFLEQTPETAMTPEALRRLADLKIEQEYGYVQEGAKAAPTAAAATVAKPALDKPQPAAPIEAGGAGKKAAKPGRIAAAGKESEKDFEKRVAKGEKLLPKNESALAAPTAEAAADLENANAREAVELYKKLLTRYPLYERNDQVLYQLSRAYQELGEVENAMDVMNRLVKAYPNSHYVDEVQFRRAEYYFTRKKFLDAEEAYKAVVTMGKGSSYYELALYKLGWSLYKQELYEEGVEKFTSLLDYKVSIGYEFEQQHDQTESQRIDDTFRVISLSFSNLGGASSVVEFFGRHGKRSYEEKVYSHLADFYLDKRRYSDAATSYKTFVDLYPFHEVSPQFHMRMIEIYKKGNFGQLVVEQKKEFAKTYALNAEYWRYFDVKKRPDVVGFLKENLKDLANYYHAGYQKTRSADEKRDNYREALLWYRNYLASFPAEPESPALNYQMADLMLENKDFGDAAATYEHIAYDYPAHDKSSAAAYAAVYAWRELLKATPEGKRGEVKQRSIQSSLKFADTFPQHEKVPAVLSVTADELYEMRNYELANGTAHKLIDNFPKADKELIRSAWLVVGHAALDQLRYAEAENGYGHVLELTPPDDKLYAKVLDNLAAAIYKQGEQANQAGDYKMAAQHFLRVGERAPASAIRVTAEYDASAALIKLEDWQHAATVLENFRKNFPGNKLQFDVTKKIAFVYRSDGRLEMAAAEYERIEREAKDEDIRRGSLDIAAELYRQSGAAEQELSLYKRYVKLFPKPLDQVMDITYRMAGVYKKVGNEAVYKDVLKQLIKMDATAGRARNERTRYLAAQASLVFTGDAYDKVVAVKLSKPFKENLKKKKQYMQEAIKAYTRLVDFQVGDVTAAATYYIAEIYYDFSRALAQSERPTNLNAEELEQYELALEEQIFPFEEKAIATHKKNLELIQLGVFSTWIDKSLGKLAALVPAAYARKEESTGFIATIDGYRYVAGQRADKALAADSASPSGMEKEDGGNVADRQISGSTLK
ncbi:MAG: outer membrane protein assembly factor BamD [Nitrosomonadales bacterium]|nr:outer membrane protein assembly factor BamD [Nitrosomonadales bacterium]